MDFETGFSLKKKLHHDCQQLWWSFFFVGESLFFSSNFDQPKRFNPPGSLDFQKENTFLYKK